MWLELEIERLDGDIEVLEAGEVTLGGRDGGIGNELIIECRCTFASRHEADPAGAVGGPGHQATAEKTLDIDGDIIFFLAQAFAPAPDFRDAAGGSPAFAGILDDMAQAGMALEDLLEGIVHDPIDLRSRKAAFEAGQHRQCLDDIA